MKTLLRHTLPVLLLLLCPLWALCQETVPATEPLLEQALPALTESPALPVQTGATTTAAPADALREAPAAPPYEAALPDSALLRLPPLSSRGTLACYPYWGGTLSGLSHWQLHPGLNVSLSASAIIGTGRHGGSGFANSAALMYAGSITPRLSYAVGAYSTMLDYGGRQMHDAGLTAMLDYRFDEHWEATAFVQKSVVQPRLMPQHYWLSDVGDKIGASVRYHFNPNVSIGVSVWSQNTPVGYAPYACWP